VVSLLVNNIGDILPIVVPTLLAYSKHHWNKTIHGLAYSALKITMDCDPRAFDSYIGSLRMSGHGAATVQSQGTGNTPQTEQHVGSADAKDLWEVKNDSVEASGDQTENPIHRPDLDRTRENRARGAYAL